MKIKTFSAMDNNRLDTKVNTFLSDGNLEVIDIKYSNTIFYFSAMIIYVEK